MINTALLAAMLLGQTATNPTAPELVGNWINIEKGFKWADRKGKVTIVHFWTFGCINCKRNLDTYNRWAEQYKKNDIVVVGVHTPELDFEKDEKKLAEFIKEKKITYPILVDGKNVNWKNWKQGVWPTIYVIDKKGKVRGQWTGELEWQKAGGTVKVEGWIKQLLAEKE